MFSSSAVLFGPGETRGARREAAAPSRVLVHWTDRYFSWLERRRSRRVLLTLDDRALADIGLDRGRALAEGEGRFRR